MIRIAKPEDARPGDVVFVHSTAFLSRLIQFGEWFRFRGGCRWNHACIVVSPQGTTDPVVAQAEARGVTLSHLSTVAGPRNYAIARAENVTGSLVARYARKQVGVRYGFLTIASIVINILTPRFIRFDFRRAGTLICSAHSALSLLAGGWMQPVKDYYSISPAQLAMALGVR